MKHLLIIVSILLFSSFLFSSEKKEQGDFTFPNGANYKGELKDGKRWNGKMYDKEGNIIGKWVNGVLQK